MSNDDNTLPNDCAQPYLDNITRRVENALQGKNPSATTYAFAKQGSSYTTDDYTQLDDPPHAPYERREFQKQFVCHLQDMLSGDADKLCNVLVASPTGTGKTDCIVSAIVEAQKRGMRVWVGTHLVALALQHCNKLRRALHDEMYETDYDTDDDEDASETDDDEEDDDDEEEEPQVGLRTGPFEKDPDAPNLVATNEIVLLEMNHRPETFGDVALIVIDEIHELDSDRGHVIEDMLTHPLLPKHVCFVGLSGTLPNALDLAEHMGRANQRPTFVIGETKRPIAIDTFLHPGNGCRTDDGEARLFHKVWNSEAREFDVDAYAYARQCATVAKLDGAQKRGRLLRLMQDLEAEQKYPVMIIDFSCRGLDRHATSLGTLDLLPINRRKAMVTIQFNQLRKKVPEEEWGLFTELEELAKRGIGKHHSQLPRPYLELLPKLVKMRAVLAVFCTSTLSAGIDLPVRTVVLLGWMVPSGPHGQRTPIDPSLYLQIQGRAGRPGMETEGNLVLATWQDPRSDGTDLAKLICSQAAPVRSRYRLTQPTVLRALLHHEPVVQLLQSSFACRNLCHIPALIQECRTARRHVDLAHDDPLLLGRKALTRFRRAGNAYLKECWGWASKALDKRGTQVWIDPEPGQLHVQRATVTGKRRSGNVQVDLAAFPDGLPSSWLLYIKPKKKPKNVRLSLDAHEARQELDRLVEGSALVAQPTRESKVLKQAFLLDQHVADLSAMIKLENLWLWPAYRTMLEDLQRAAFVDDGVVSLKGRAAACLVATEDPSCLVEALLQGLLPTDNAIEMGALLTCFLYKRRHDQPRDEQYRAIEQLQEKMHPKRDPTVGSGMIAPTRAWLQDGASVLTIVQEHDISPGHFCKELQRLVELLRQLEECAKVLGEERIIDAVATVRKLVERPKSLPFVPSLLL